MKLDEDVGAFSITIRPKVVLLELLLIILFVYLGFPLQLAENGKLERTRWYNEDLESVFNVTYLPFAIDDPSVEKGVGEILDRHDIRLDAEYDKGMKSYYKKWGRVIARGPKQNDKSVYIARAGKKGHGVYAGRLLKAGELVSVYTGIRVLREKHRDSTYMWDYTRVKDKYGNCIYLDTDARLGGNLLRFINDDPGGAGRNCEMIEVCFGVG
jgi:hypothetical protein